MILPNKGKVVSIFVVPRCGPFPPPAGGHSEHHSAKEVEEVVAVEDMGLEGDRWFGVKEFRKQDGSLKLFSHKRQVSFIAHEDVLDMEVDAIELRRNILTEGVKLFGLVDRIFIVGEAKFKWTGLCKYCKHIEDCTRPGMMEALHPRGGIRAEILRGGVIRKGDEICY